MIDMTSQLAGPEHGRPPTSVPVRTFAVLGALAVALGVAFVLAPRVLAANAAASYTDQGDLVAAVRTAFVEYWQTGDRGFTPAMATLVDYWTRYHLVKAGIAAMLLVVLVGLGVRLWRAFVRAGRRGAVSRWALASAGSVVALGAIGAVALVMANVQGAVAPFASLLSMLPSGASDARLAHAVDQIRQGLAGHPPPTPVLDVMVSDFGRYHAVLAGLAVVVAIGLVVLSVLAWTRFARTRGAERLSDWRARPVWAALGAFSAVFALVVIVVAVANTTTAADPAPALLASFNGSW